MAQASDGLSSENPSTSRPQVSCSGDEGTALRALTSLGRATFPSNLEMTMRQKAWDWPAYIICTYGFVTRQ